MPKAHLSKDMVIRTLHYPYEIEFASVSYTRYLGRVNVGSIKRLGQGSSKIENYMGPEAKAFFSEKMR